jgi:integrase
MASIFRQKYTVEENGKRKTKQSQHWYIDYKAVDGTRKRIKGFKDKTATAQLAAKLEKESELAQAGIIDKYKEHRKRPLAEHLDDFKTGLLNKGTTQKHACLVYNRAKAVIENGGFIFVSDISASKVQIYLGGRRREGLSIRSSNFYLQAVKQFSRWLVADNRTAENPLAYLAGQNPKTDIRHARRALSIDELDRLITSTLKGQEHSNMSGKERAILYTLAVNTGLRASELASLTWQSFNLESPKPSVTVLAAYSKHRRDDILPLRSDIAQQLKTYRQTQTGEKVFANFRPNKAANMFRKDLEKAGIDYIDEAGKVADFHSLRHTFISNLSQGGVSPKVAQSLARHSTINLTMDTYTHIGLHDERAALEKLPHLQTDSGIRENAVALKSGTDDRPVNTDNLAYKPAYKKLAKNAFSISNQSSLIDNRASIEQDNPPKSVESSMSLETGMLGSENNQLSLLDTQEKERSRRDSNPRYPKGKTVFKTVAFSRSATAPYKIVARGPCLVSR